MTRSGISSTRNLSIDIGSGYNPAPGYRTADITRAPFLDYVIKGNRIYSGEGEIADGTVACFRMRNVAHHVRDLDGLLGNLLRYLRPGGTLEIIDCDAGHYAANRCLDNLWYRYVIPRKEIYIAGQYRDYAKIAKKLGFRLKKKFSESEKETTILEKDTQKHG